MSESSGRPGFNFFGRGRLADMWADLHIWIERCSNWQFVAVAAGVNVLAQVVAACVLGLISSFNLAAFITSGATEAIVITGFLAWRRWK